MPQPPVAQGRNPGLSRRQQVGPDCRSVEASGGRQRRKTTLEIGLELVDILQADVEPQRRPAGGPFGRGAIFIVAERNDEAFKAAPRKARAEQPDGLD